MPPRVLRSRDSVPVTCTCLQHGTFRAVGEGRRTSCPRLKRGEPPTSSRRPHISRLAMPRRDAPVDDTRRYDLYLTAASAGTVLPAVTGGSTAYTAIDAGVLAIAFFDAIKRHVHGLGRIPSLFYAPCSVQESDDEAVDATLQTRGGGVAMFLITAPFLQDDTCVTQLLRFLRMQEDAPDGAEVKFRLVLVGLSEKDFRQHPVIQPLAPHLAGYRLHSISVRALAQTVFDIVQLTVNAWLSASSPSVLGETVRDSLLDLLRRVFQEHDTATAKMVFGIEDPRMTTLTDVFSAAFAEYRIGSSYDGSALLDKLVTVGSGLMSDEKRAAVTAFERKWVRAGAWSWDSDSRGALMGVTL